MIDLWDVWNKGVQHILNFYCVIYCGNALHDLTIFTTHILPLCLHYDTTRFLLFAHAVCSLCSRTKVPYSRDHFVHAPNQWEATLLCNVGSHWLGANTVWIPEQLFLFVSCSEVYITVYLIVKSVVKYLFNSEKGIILSCLYNGLTLSIFEEKLSYTHILIQFFTI